MKQNRSTRGRPIVALTLQKTRNAFVNVARISAVINLLMLVGPRFMMQVYDRVLTSRSVPTLVALSGLAIGLYLFLGLLVYPLVLTHRRIRHISQNCSTVSQRSRRTWAFFIVSGISESSPRLRARRQADCKAARTRRWSLRAAGLSQAQVQFRRCHGFAKSRS